MLWFSDSGQRHRNKRKQSPCIQFDFENQSFLRTNRTSRWPKVLFQLSTCSVNTLFEFRKERSGLHPINETGS